MEITLHKYYNGQAITLDADQIDTAVRHSAEDDAKWGADHLIDAKPYTAITMKAGAKTSEGVGTAYVSETPEMILSVDPVNF